MSNKTDLEMQKELGEAPEWLDEVGYKTLASGYLQDLSETKKETVNEAITRVCHSVSSYLNKPQLESLFKEATMRNWLCYASPIWSNAGTARGLPISCNSIHVGDSVSSIFKKNTELAMLTKFGAGVGIYMGDVRSRGVNITGNGKSEGIIPWLKVLEVTTNSVSQGSTRRGATATYVPATHGDIKDFLLIRRATGDHNMRARNMNIGVCISDQFLQEADDGNKHNRELWHDILKERFEQGEPYLLFTDNANRQKPESYVKNNLDIKTSNICNEIYQYTDPDHTFVCCLSSLNLDRYDEWKDFKFSNGMTLPELSTWFLDGIMSEYIDKAQHIEHFECSVRSAIKGRALGLGVLGFHSYLQRHMVDMEGFEAFKINNEIFKFINEQSLKASQDMAVEYGEPEWCKGLGVRNTLRTAVAPTATNSTISGGVSPGIEPIAQNLINLKSAKGNFEKYNRDLKKLLVEKGLDTQETWTKIINDNGSVKNIKQLSKEEKEVFKTAREMNQHTLIKLASQRQKYIDQGQSLNLFFTSNCDARYLTEVHRAAHSEGLKGLYYCRSTSVLSSSASYRSPDECIACEG